MLIAPDGTIASWVAAGSERIEQLVYDAVAGEPEPEGLPIGTEAPLLELPALDGEPVALADLRGREALLLFWNPDCGSRRSMHEDLPCLGGNGRRRRPSARRSLVRRCRGDASRGAFAPASCSTRSSRRDRRSARTARPWPSSSTRRAGSPHMSSPAATRCSRLPAGGEAEHPIGAGSPAPSRSYSAPPPRASRWRLTPGCRAARPGPARGSTPCAPLFHGKFTNPRWGGSIDIALEFDGRTVMNIAGIAPGVCEDKDFGHLVLPDGTVPPGRSSGSTGPHENHPRTGSLPRLGPPPGPAGSVQAQGVGQRNGNVQRRHSARHASRFDVHEIRLVQGERIVHRQAHPMTPRRSLVMGIALLLSAVAATVAGGSAGGGRPPLAKVALAGFFPSGQVAGRCVDQHSSARGARVLRMSGILPGTCREKWTGRVVRVGTDGAIGMNFDAQPNAVIPARMVRSRSRRSRRTAGSHRTR